MGKIVDKTDYEKFVKSLKGPLESINGEIYYVSPDTFSTFMCSLYIVIHEKEIQPDIIFKMLTEIAEKFRPMYHKYMDEEGSGMDFTTVKIRDLLITGGANEFIGVNLVDSMTTVLPVERLQWVRELRPVKSLMKYLEDPIGYRSVMELDDTTVEKLNRTIKQLQSQKNVPHNLQVHLDFIEEGTFIVSGKEIYYKFPDNIKLKFVCDPKNHNKITGEIDFGYRGVRVDYPISRENGLIMEDTLTTLVSDKLKQILKSNDLTPINFASNSTNYEKSIFRIDFNFIG